MNVKCRIQKTYHHENPKNFIHPITDFNFSHHGKITSKINPEKPDVPLNKNDAFQKVQKRRVQEKR